MSVYRPNRKFNAQTTVSAQPEINWPKWCTKEEDRFAFSQYFTPARVAKFDGKHKQPAPLEFWIHFIREEWPEAPHELPTFEGSRLIVRAVKTFGIEAIHCDRACNRFLPDEEQMEAWSDVCTWTELNHLVSSAIMQWRRNVNLGRVNPSLYFLKEIGKALTPPAKGKGKGGRTINKVDVALWYYKMLFRVTHTASILREPGKPAGERIKLASQRYGFSIDEIKTLWKLDEDNSPLCRPVSLKEMARTLTAKRFGITQHRVSNIIAS